jgi:hypothetical protein
VKGMTSEQYLWSKRLIMHSGLTIGVQNIQGSAVPMCVSSIATPLAVRALATTTFTNGASSSFYEQVIDRSTVSSISTLSSGVALADPLYVAWEESDLSRFPSENAVSLAAKIGVRFTPSPTPSPTTTRASAASSRGASQTGSAATQSPTATPNTDSGGLSSGAKIGIGVGVGLGSAALLALIAMGLVIRRLRRRNREAIAPQLASTPAMESHEADLTTNKWYQRSRPDASNDLDELDSFPVQVVPGPPSELEGSLQAIRRY